MASVIVNYCSNERAFIDALLTECQKFSDDIVVSYGSKLYDGTPEDMEHIRQKREQYPEVQFVEYDVDLTLDLTKQKGVVHRPAAYWHNLARWTAVRALKNPGWVFIIDADEIPDGALVLEWLLHISDALDARNCYKIATYWYFKAATNRAQMLEDSILLMHSSHLTEKNIFGDYERDYLIAASKCKLIRQVKGVDGVVLWNHYSWVRPRSELIHKIQNWGHSSDMFKNVDAVKLVDYIFRNNDVNDVVHGYAYITVENKFNILC